LKSQPKKRDAQASVSKISNRIGKKPKRNGIPRTIVIKYPNVKKIVIKTDNTNGTNRGLDLDRFHHNPLKES